MLTNEDFLEVLKTDVLYCIINLQTNFVLLYYVTARNIVSNRVNSYSKVKREFISPKI